MIARAIASRDRQIGALVAALSLLSLGAFVGQVYGVVEMGFTLAVVSLPATICIVGIALWAVGTDHRLFYHRLLLGLWIGLAATAVYDVVRLVAQNVLPVDFNAFAIHPRFGELITGRPHTSAIANLSGWAYHLSNGITFAICYTLVAGRARWWCAVIYALALQSLMVLMYPRAFGVSRGNLDFLLIGFIGHACYGATLGILNRRYNVDEDEWDARRSSA